MTLVSYAEAQTFFDANAHRQPFEQSGIFPSEETWRPKPGTTWADYHRHVMRGVLSYRLAAWTLDELAGEQHRERLDFIRRWPLRQEYHDLESRLYSDYSALKLELLRTGDAQAMSVKFLQRFPKGKYTPEWLDQIRQENPGEYFIIHACFPYRRDDRPTPWLSDQMDRAMLGKALTFAMERYQDRLQVLLNLQEAQRRVVLVRHGRPSDRPALDRLLNELTNRDGEVAEAGFKTSQVILASLGSPTRYSLMEMSPLGIQKIFGVSPGQLPLRLTMPARSNKAGVNLIWTAAIPPVGPQRRPDVRMLSSLGDQTKQVFLRPALRRVLSRLEVVPPYDIPSEDDLVMSMPRAGTGVQLTLLWTPLPDIYEPIKDQLDFHLPWPGEGE